MLLRSLFDSFLFLLKQGNVSRHSKELLEEGPKSSCKVNYCLALLESEFFLLVVSEHAQHAADFATRPMQRAEKRLQ